MDEKLKAALNKLRLERGMAVQKADEDTSHNQATRVSLPQSQKKRKYNARHRAKSAEWLAKKKAESVEPYPSELQQMLFAASPAIADGQTNLQGHPSQQSLPSADATKKLGHQGSYASLPRPIPINDARSVSSRDMFLPDGVRIKPRPPAFVPCTFEPEPQPVQSSAMTAMEAALKGFNIIRNRDTGEHFYRTRPDGELIRCRIE